MPFWVFGFGSLVFRPGFVYAQREVGYIKGYRRVFYQGSTDHRGTPEFPGRTVTLEECPDATCWGAAFLCSSTPEVEERVMRELEWREKQYDLRVHVDVYTSDSGDAEPAVEGALTFIASPDKEANPNYLGYAPLDSLAEQIAAATGPSGPNYEYLFGVADAMRQINVDDPELFELEAKVQELLNGRL